MINSIIWIWIKKQFIFDNYKTQHKYRSVVVPIEDELMKVISLYLSNHPENSKLKNKNYHVHFLKSFYNEDIIKSIGSSMLRNLYLSNKYSNIVEDLKNDVKNMGTSVDVALNNYIKKKFIL